MGDQHDDDYKYLDLFNKAFPDRSIPRDENYDVIRPGKPNYFGYHFGFSAALLVFVLGKIWYTWKQFPPGSSLWSELDFYVIAESFAFFIVLILNFFLGRRYCARHDLVSSRIGDSRIVQRIVEQDSTLLNIYDHTPYVFRWIFMRRIPENIKDYVWLVSHNLDWFLQKPGLHLRYEWFLMPLWLLYIVFSVYYQAPQTAGTALLAINHFLGSAPFYLFVLLSVFSDKYSSNYRFLAYEFWQDLVVGGEQRKIVDDEI